VAQIPKFCIFGSHRHRNSKARHISKIQLIQHITVSNTLLSPDIYCVRKKPIQVMTKILICTVHFLHNLNESLISIYKAYADRRMIRMQHVDKEKCHRHRNSKARHISKIQLIQHITVSNTLLSPDIYCVKQNTVSTLAFNIHLFNFSLSTCCIRIINKIAKIAIIG
jgi:hypothetical protein